MSVRMVVEVLEIFGILQVCQLLIGKILRKYKEDECQNGRRDIRGLGCVFYTEARSIRDIRDITGMPASDRQNTRGIQGE